LAKIALAWPSGFDAAFLGLGVGLDQDLGPFGLGRCLHGRPAFRFDAFGLGQGGLGQQAKNEAQQAKAKKAKQGKPPAFPRETGLGCRFQLDYLEVGNWYGALIRLNDDSVLAEVDATSMRRCIIALSAAYATQEKRARPDGPAQQRFDREPGDTG
jgi:hypothetical protein